MELPPATRHLNEVLTQKANATEADEYKTWTLNIAENVAKSAREGGFLGFGGTQTSDAEVKLFDDIAAALQITKKK